MKRMLSLAVFVACAVIAGATVISGLANAGTWTRGVTTTAYRPAVGGVFLADGDPPPPWPPKTTPFPGSENTVGVRLAPQNAVLIADGDPPPPWPPQSKPFPGYQKADLASLPS